MQLANLQLFWMQSTNTRRQTKAVNITTHNKRQERLLGYLGWLKTHADVSSPSLGFFDISNEGYRSAYERYLNYLTDDRKLSIGTIVEHLTAAIYVLKFLHARYSGHYFAHGSVT